MIPLFCPQGYFAATAVLALEQRGHGDSGWAADGNYAPEAFAGDAAAFIDALNVAPTLLIGHSMGGRYAAMVTAEHPDKVSKLVMVDTPAELPPNIESLLEQQPDRGNLPEPETFDAHTVSWCQLTMRPSLRPWHRESVGFYGVVRALINPHWAQTQS